MTITLQLNEKLKVTKDMLRRAKGYYPFDLVWMDNDSGEVDKLETIKSWEPILTFDLPGIGKVEALYIDKTSHYSQTSEKTAVWQCIPIHSTAFANALAHAAQQMPVPGLASEMVPLKVRFFVDTESGLRAKLPDRNEILADEHLEAAALAIVKEVYERCANAITASAKSWPDQTEVHHSARGGITFPKGMEWLDEFLAYDNSAFAKVMEFAGYAMIDYPLPESAHGFNANEGDGDYLDLDFDHRKYFLRGASIVRMRRHIALPAAISLLIGAWSNFYYGWSFAQTSSVIMLPLVFLAYVGALIFTKEWQPQPIWVDFKPQVTLACSLLLLAILVMSAVATAASTRLGQVMTIVVCSGVFVASLLSNHFVGRQAYSNQTVGQIDSVAIENPLRPNFDGPGDEAMITLKQPPLVPLKPGTSFYFGPNPSGFDLAVEPFEALSTPPGQTETLVAPGSPSRLIVTGAQGLNITVKQVGEKPLAMRAIPARDDYVFVQPTKTNFGALAAWGAFPNLHFFYLIDAVTQNQKIPLSYAGLAACYSLFQIGAMLSLAVALFQTRDVG